MGHKVNAISFRIRKCWDSFYFLNNSLKLNNYLIQDLNIKKYIERVCLHQDKVVLSFKIFRDFNNVFIFLKLFYWKNYRNKFLRSKKKTRLSSYYNLNKIMNLEQHLKTNIQSFFNISNALVFIIKNKSQKFFYKTLILKKLSSFKFNKFFRKSLQFIKFSFETKNVKLLSISIARAIERDPKHLRFFSFLKKILIVFYSFYNFNSSTFKKIKGYRIEINGKFNGKPRAKKKIIAKGPMPFSSIDSNITYHFSQAYTKYGVFGIKVWFYIS